MKKMFSLLFMFSASTLNAQPTYDWACTRGGSTADNGWSIATDNNGNIFTTGDFTGVADFNPWALITTLSSSGGKDVFVSKQDPDGNLLWVKKFGGMSDDTGKGIQTDASGNVYFTGSYQGTTDFNPGAGIYNLPVIGAENIFVCKLDASGNFVWAFGLGSNSSDNGVNLTLHDTAIYLACNFSGTVDFDPGTGITNLVAGGTSSDGAVAAYSLDGNFYWAHSIGGSGADNVESIAIDPAGFLYAGGWFNGAVDFDPGTGSATMTAAGKDAFICKYTTTGVYQWVAQFGGSGSDQISAVACDPSGNIIAGGYFNGTVDFNPGAGTDLYTSSSLADNFLVKLDANKVLVWNKICGTGNDDYTASICTDDWGNIYVTGSFYGMFNVDPGATNFMLGSTGFGVDSYIIKKNSNGDLVWAKQLVSGPEDYGTDITVDSNQDIYVTGIFTGTVDFNPDPASTANIAGNGNYDTYVFKWLQCTTPATPVTISGATVICGTGNYTYSVTNDPAVTTYNWTLPAGWTGNSTTNSITVNTTGTGGIISVTATGACGTSAPQSTSITQYSLPNTGISQSGTTLTANTSGANYLWLDCDNALEPVGGATGQIFNPTHNGNYTVIVNTNGCADTGVCVTVTGISDVGFMEQPEYELLVAPNPSNGIFYCTIPAAMDYLVVYNLLGEQVHQQSITSTTFALDLEHLPAGSYIVTFIQPENAIKVSQRIQVVD